MNYPSNLSIRNWAEEDRPREKLLMKGKAALSEAELIAILLGSGTRSISAVELAKQLLSAVDNDLNKLAMLSVKELIKFNGIGEAKAINIISALEIGRRRKDTLYQEQPKIQSSKQIYELMKPELLDLDHEEFWVVFLNRTNKVLKKEQCSSGGISGTVVDSRLIYKKAIEERACSIILVHNHPSGNLKPSQADIDLTKKMKDSGKILDIPVLDHIIFANNGYFSFTDESIL
ncbi:DNA repair protein RadC [Reichenbachiella sp. MALMAid0571]|uniref:RadC family protein n=1 Tax=Reichenbachiella sp. MALMAid0571 TaxID=3143939 RepID=UPI0032DE4F7E